MKKYLAEFIGTMVLVIFGCGSAVAANTLVGNNVSLVPGTDQTPLALTTLLIAFAFGLSIVAMAYSIGNISGCHVNPAVSLAMFMQKKLSGADLIGYVVSQILGALAGAGILCAMFGSNASLGTNGYGEQSALGSNAGQAFLVEVVLTFVFVLVIIGVTSKVENNAVAGLVIGLTLTLVHILGIPFTGTSVNPARSLGPAIVAGGVALEQVWLFIIAPLVGAALASIVYRVLAGEKKAKA